jgi:general secretion pathway protein D
MIIIRTSDKDAMTSISLLIEELDRPTPQVLLEVRILEITLGDQFKSAFDFEFTKGKTPAYIPNNGGQTINPVTGIPFAASNLVNTATEQFFGDGNSILDNNGMALGSGNFGVEPDGSTFVYQFLDHNFRARVQLLEQENRVNVVATPILLASNNRPASLRIGEERRLTDSASTLTNSNQGGQTTGTAVNTSQRQIGTSLMLLPKINADRTVTMTIYQERTGDDTGKEDIIPISATQTVTRPVISNATTVNTIVAHDGLTVAIGGMIEERVVKKQIKVPLLGDLPTVGALFRKDFEQSQKTELIILITPHVISTPQQASKKTQASVNDNSVHPYVRNGYQNPKARPQVKNLPKAYGTQETNRLFQGK